MLVLSDLYYSFNTFAHTLFVVKYWVISKKIEGIITKQEDPRLEVKSYAILVSVLLLVVISLIMDLTFTKYGIY